MTGAADTTDTPGTAALGAELRTLAEQLAVRAGKSVFEARRAGTGDVTTKSTPTDMVTEHDRASEALIVGAIRAARPDDGIIGEEGTADEGTSGVHWLIDPIDGTTNFFYGLPGYAVSIAAADARGALAGAVYVPATGELFSAARGQGATLDGSPIACSTTAELSTTLVATGFNYRRERRIMQAERLVHMIGEIRDIRRMGAASHDLCSVAAGRVDAYFEEGLGPWDIAAGALIATEAGCITGDYAGGPIRPEQVLVANPAIFEPLRDLINAATRP
ncbi:MAG: putative inositol monophosphatase [Ilumatobacteraceae bacterium]|nr:putative inositol monophosphatase [Ilumatobacteraceae bacterium]